MSNPFAGLVDESLASGKRASAARTLPSETMDLEEIFGFTLNADRAADQQLVYLEDQDRAFAGNDLDVRILEHALADRLFLQAPEKSIPKNGKDIADNRVEAKVMYYLHECYKRNKQIDSEIRRPVNAIILRYVVTALSAPAMYPCQEIYAQFLQLLKDDLDEARQFFQDTYDAFAEENGGCEAIRLPFTELLKLIHVDVARMTISSMNLLVFDIIKLYVSYADLADVFMQYTQPASSQGYDFSNTILGAMFAISGLPKTSTGSYDFFANPLDAASNSATENILTTGAQLLVHTVHSILFQLLKSSAEIRARLLLWLGNCIRCNANRGKLWNMHTPGTLASSNESVSDGFMLNLGAVLLKFCMPFCEPQHTPKILKVDPTYCGVTQDDAADKGVHLPNLANETCLLPCDGQYSNRKTSSNFSFVSECFYMAHKAIELGFQVAVEKLVRLNQEMGRIERTYNYVFAQSPDNPLVEEIKSQMSTEMSRYLSIKATLSEPSMLEMLFHLMSASSYWLSQAVVNDFSAESIDFVPLVHKSIEFPITSATPDTFKCIPEFIIENIITYMVFLRRFNPKVYEMHGYKEMQPMLTFILVYMGSAQRVKNPHLRARLAEALEALLPFHKEEPIGMNAQGYQREMLFNQHEHRNQIVRNLLEVFVGIEMTGQSVEFEQKFNYRRPMYIVMDYLWELEEHRNVFTTLAHEAEENMEAVTPPLFLRFINLLMNDAVFLLDESLANMSKLKEIETVRESDAWDSLPPSERMQNIQYFEHIGMIAQFDNILGKDTIQTIERLTSQITIVFTHSTMVDRIAAMLNYFLLNLVGPKQKNFKVKDSKSYNFDPAGTVLDICKIYVHLKENDDFCLAVSQDGRSYRPTLFGLAEDVLIRIGGGSLIGELQELAAKVTRLAEENQVTEDALVDAPETYLDPIMSTLMLDPVTLPSSKQTVDRSTIARHLLSDQTDPFNRSPLTMDQVIPNKELAEEIKAWLSQKKASRA